MMLLKMMTLNTLDHAFAGLKGRGRPLENVLVILLSLSVLVILLTLSQFWLFFFVTFVLSVALLFCLIILDIPQTEEKNVIWTAAGNGWRGY